MAIAEKLAVVAALALLGLGGGQALAAQDQAPSDSVRPDVVEQVYQCRQIAEAQERLACYDAAVTELAGAEQRRELMFADRAQVNKTKKGLFGLNLSNLNIFGGGDDKDEIDDITATIVSVGRLDRRWVLVLDDGARWSQADTKTLPRNPKSGMEVKIRRAALGSYLANVDGMNAMRVKRTN